METASHELKTPNTVISGYIELVLEQYKEAIPSDAYKWLEVVLQNARRLEHITDNMLKLKEIESGLVRVNRTSVLIESMINDVIDKKRENLAANALFIYTDIDVDSVFADREMLNFVITELLDNAIKFSNRKSTITLSVTNEADYVVFSVNNHGVIIDPSDFDRIFTPFEYIPKPQYYTGIGNSLSLCKAYVELHNGTIIVNSSEESGTTFIFMIPDR